MPVMNHPTDAGRSKNVPDDLVEKFVGGGWTTADEKPAPKKRATTKKASEPAAVDDATA